MIKNERFLFLLILGVSFCGICQQTSIHDAKERLDAQERRITRLQAIVDTKQAPVRVEQMKVDVAPVIYRGLPGMEGR
jgi:hypothetical protein